MATPLYPTAGLVDFVVSEAALFRSRDNVKVTQSGTALKSGTVLSKSAGSFTVRAEPRNGTHWGALPFECIGN